VKRNYLSSNPVTTIKTPKQDKKLPKFLEYEQVMKLLNTPPANTWLGARDRAILEVLYSTGMRVSELVGLNMDDVDFLSEVIHIRAQRQERTALPHRVQRATVDSELYRVPQSPDGQRFGVRQQGAVRQQARQTAEHTKRSAEDGQVPD
jgi:site-specific recombinase XerC